MKLWRRLSCPTTIPSSDPNSTTWTDSWPAPECSDSSISETPTLFIIVGPNGSGKSSITEAMDLDEILNGLSVNPDLIAEDLYSRIQSNGMHWRRG